VDAPSLDEQKLDVIRQERMKVLAAKADERWAAKPRVMDAPEMQQAVPGLRSPRKEEASRVPGTLSEDVRETFDTKAPETSMESGIEDTTATTQSREAVGDHKGSWDKLKEDEKKRAAGQAKGPDPWKRARGPSEAWQPEGWNPPAAPKRR
jgi:NADH dehydrogenase [ubiquinone] 1 alpha subcomplex assembly factor 2